MYDVDYLLTLTVISAFVIVTCVEEKKQPPPSAYRVPDAIAADFDKFVEHVQRRLPKAHKGQIAGAGLLGVMLADDQTLDGLISLVAVYTPNRYTQPHNAKLDLERLRKALKVAAAAPPPSPSRTATKKTATG